jgi:hypothetical protein
MMLMAPDKDKMTDGIVSSILNGEEEYNTQPKKMDEAAHLCAAEFSKAIESKDSGKIIAALSALMHEIGSMKE